MNAGLAFQECKYRLAPICEFGIDIESHCINNNTEATFLVKLDSNRSCLNYSLGIV
jgi:hypothetical protein